jgi:hypothetical protein
MSILGGAWKTTSPAAILAMFRTQVCCLKMEGERHEEGERPEEEEKEGMRGG